MIRSPKVIFLLKNYQKSYRSHGLGALSAYEAPIWGASGAGQKRAHVSLYHGPDLPNKTIFSDLFLPHYCIQLNKSILLNLPLLF